MRVISLRPLRDFWIVHPDSERPLRLWYKTACAATWHSLADVRRTYPSADGVTSDVETLTIFNIRGNKYRLIARIRFDYGLVNVRSILSHDDYDQEKWKGRT